MKIAFDFIADETPLFIAVGEHLKREGLEVVGLTLGNRWRRLWEGRFRTAPIATASINYKKIEFPYDLKKEMDRIEREYGQFHPASFPQKDRFLANYKRTHQIVALVDAFQSIEKFFFNESPDIYFCTPIAYLFNLVSHSICKRHGIPHISLYTTRGVVPRFTYSTGISGRWDAVTDLYQKIIADFHTVDKHVIESAKEELNLFRSVPHRPYYMRIARVNYKFRSIFIKEFFVRMKYYYIEGWGRNSADYMTKSPFWYAWRDIKKFVRAPLFMQLREIIFDTVEEGIPYYLFPLNAQPESSTLIHSPWYVDLPTTIRNISCCLPAGTYLYVKEHTSAFGRRGLKFYKAIKASHNVRLLGHWENTDPLIINSKGVILLSSTMGWEALKHRKPIYALGDLFCNDISPVISIHSYDDLRSRLYEDYHNDYATPIVSDEMLVAFAAALQFASHPGLFAPAKMDMRDSVLSPENVRQVAKGLKQIIAYECKEKVLEEMKR
jgi:hypothetical protein